jgi:hypothetical protein
MIAGALMGKRVEYCSSVYHKVPAIAEYALKGFRVTRDFNLEEELIKKELQLRETERAKPSIKISLPEAEKEQTIQSLRRELAEIKGSRAWRYIQPLRRFHIWLQFKQKRGKE